MKGESSKSRERETRVIEGREKRKKERQGSEERGRKSLYMCVYVCVFERGRECVRERESARVCVCV